MFLEVTFRNNLNSIYTLYSFIYFNLIFEFFYKTIIVLINTYNQSEIVFLCSHFPKVFCHFLKTLLSSLVHPLIFRKIQIFASLSSGLSCMFIYDQHSFVILYRLIYLIVVKVCFAAFIYFFKSLSLLSWESFTTALGECKFPLKVEWQQVSSNLLYSYRYSSRP